ncbi:glycosyltransferase family 2 protein [Paenibacillus sacheonensis]|uniref:Glycosyltransferase n=1 Tax=Paenibacillus sacheonensis TaxID=742054 RepID=A0A7X5BXK1_9BACL|nr:glycosyltransferase family 2 protein [Paenibacillus sacheonensis]MBM7568326.1 glycosyltransferase involved in cell wall biosynthesis [Paenibacillus sacheonensis]NBC68491.1 glycosyltransferase [Paenibacillus sacheonensis]
MNKPDDRNAVREALRAGRYDEAEQLATAGIQAEPLAPQSWVYLGEALLHGGYANAARRVFDRAALLDPQARWMPDVERALVSRSAGPDRADIVRLLEPPYIVSVAAAVLTRNEARSIGRCIESLLGAVDEIIIVDSNSTDGTIEIAARYPNVKILQGVALKDDFAGKRNAALPHIQSDWVLWVDADEWLFPEDARAVRETAGLFHRVREHIVLNISQVNHVSGKQMTDFGMPRLFPMNRGLRYYGRVHEQVVIQGEDMYDEAILRRNVRIRLHHDGYEPERMAEKGKVARNLRLLAIMTEEEPDNPGWLLYYARESLAAGHSGAAKEALLKAEAAAESTPGFGRHLQIYQLLHNIHMSERDFREAELACRKALAVQPDFPDALYHLAQAQAALAAEALRQAQQHAEEAKSAFRTYRGAVSADEAIADWKADLLIADLESMRGRRTEAKAKYEALFARHPELAERRMKRRGKDLS